MHNPDAVFDALYVCDFVKVAFGSISQLQLQKLTFLACLLSLYEGAPANEWGYVFSTTEFGRPISPEITEAIDFHVARGRLSLRDGRYEITLAGASLLEFLLTQATLSRRMPFLKAACQSAIALPSEIFNKGLSNEPTIVSSNLRSGGANLLQGTATVQLYQDFEGLSGALGAKSEVDLSIPSMVWLSYNADPKLTGEEQIHG